MIKAIHMNRMVGAARRGLILVAVFALSACNAPNQPPSTPAGPPAMPPVAAKIAQPIHRQVVDWDEFTGHIDAVESVQIRARVNGYLERVNFRDGQLVRRGDLLFVIDQRPYQADWGRAQAQLAEAQVRLQRARNDLARGEKLRKSRAMSEEEYDARSKAVLEGEAAIQGAEAAARAARLNLDYTEVHSPINGKIGRELITVGNLVRADETLLTTVVSVDPVYVYLDADERAVLRFRRWQEKTKTGGGLLPAELALSDETGFPHRGHIDYVDPWLEPATGTLRTRGVFANPTGLLSPGLFARVRIQAGGEYQSLLIPERAIASDQGEKFVWLAKDDGSVEYRRVVPGASFGGLRVIQDGLKGGEWVVVEGGGKIRPGAKLAAEKVPAEAVPDAAKGAAK